MGWLRVIWYVLTLRCEEADRVRSVAREGERLRAGARVGERVHTSLCRNCRRARRRLRELDRLVSELREDAGAAPMPPDARERLRGVLANARSEPRA